MSAPVEDIADWLGDMPEAHNVVDHTDEATTVISIDVETLAGRISVLMDDYADGMWPWPEMPWQRLRTAVSLEQRAAGAPAGITPWKVGDTIYGLAVSNDATGGLWEYRPEPFTLDGVDATAYVVADDQEWAPHRPICNGGQ